METTYSVSGAIEPLKRGETVRVKGYGNSMTPLINSGEVVTVVPIRPGTELHKGDVVLVKVRSAVYLHRVKALKPGQVQIGNNHGGINGWTPLDQVFGRWDRTKAPSKE